MVNNDKPANIRNQRDLFYSGINSRDKVHLRVDGLGQVTDEAVFLREVEFSKGIRVSLKGKEIDFLWSDVIELWPLPKPPPAFQAGDGGSGALESQGPA